MLRSKLLFFKICFFSILPILFSGCLTYRDIVNFQDGSQLGKNLTDSISNKFEVRLKPEDIINVTVTSYIREESERFNLTNSQQSQQMSGMAGGASVSDPFGYRIDTKGNIELPIVGPIYVSGLTIEECREVIYKKVKATGYLKDLVVQVRFLSFRVSIMGEVNSPGTYTIPSQSLTILEALGMAHDVTMFSKRDNILVIREKNGVRNYGRINLKTKEVFKSPYFYLQPNDIVYVEPHKSKILAAPDPASRYISTIMGTISFVLLLLKLI